MYNWLDDDAQEGRGGDRGGRALGFLGRRVHTWHEYRALPHFGGGGIVETELQIREDPKRRPVRRVQCHSLLFTRSHLSRRRRRYGYFCPECKKQLRILWPVWSDRRVGRRAAK